jgi:hypothetical protein
VLTWDTGHAATDVNAGAGEGDVTQGKLWCYQTATGKRRSVPLPETTVVGSEERKGVFGYSSHAGNTLFWIAATKVNVGKGVTVEASAVYAATL